MGGCLFTFFTHSEEMAWHGEERASELTRTPLYNTRIYFYFWNTYGNWNIQYGYLQ
jgi:hypothetical protein